MSAAGDWILREIRRMPLTWAILLVATLAAATYANTLDAGFHYDDTHHVLENPYVRDTAFIPQHFTRPDMFSGLRHLRMYRPALMTTFCLNYSWGGYRPLPWRLTALALHAFGAVGVLLLFRRLASTLRGEGRGPASAGALVAALLFALHPVFSETVDYVSARSSQMATALLVWALYLHLAAEEARRPPLRLAGWCGSLVLFAAALLTKSIAIVYPALLLAVVLLRGRGWKGVLPALAVALLYLAARQILLGQAVIDFAPRQVADADPYDGGRRPILWNLYTQSRVLLAYLALLVWPAGLSVDHYVRVSRTPLEPGVLLGVAVALGLLVVAWRLRRTRPMVALGIVWFLVALAPTSSVIPLNVIMNEHRLYLPGVGFALVVGALLGPAVLRWGPRRRTALAAAALLLAALTAVRGEDWRDPVRLWQQATRVSPRSHGAWNNLGVQLNNRHGDLDGARKAFERALECNPRAWDVTFNMASLCLHHGRERGDEALLGEAERWTERSLELEPGAYRSRWCLAEVMWARGDKAAARAAFDRLASESSYFFELTRYVYARMAMEEGNLGDAEAYYEQALELDDDPVSPRLGLAEVAKRAGSPREARTHAHAAAEKRPHDPRPYLFLARLERGPQAVRYLFEAERRGYRPTPSERREILERS